MSASYHDRARGLYTECFSYLFSKIFPEDNYYGIDFENDVFEVHPYYWGDCDCFDESNFADSFGDDISHKEGCKVDCPNFLYKPTGFCASWYKYPWRGVSYSEELNRSELQKIVDHCLESLKENNNAT